jgi:glycosyltransferase involved in cell wall biosynthesis
VNRPDRVAVLVVSHDYGRFLDEALGSVVDQTRPPDEIVLVDDASADDTPEVAARWADKVPELTVVRNERNLGPARTFNRGFGATTADLLVKLDGDDRLSPAYLERHAAMLADPRVDIAYAGLREFGASARLLPARPFDARALMRENFVNGSAMMRRRVWEWTGGYRMELDAVGLEDWELVVHAVALGMRAAPVDGCRLEYRRHPSGSRNSLGRRDAWRAHRLVHRWHPHAVRRSDVAAWAARGAGRALAGRSRRGL